MPTPKILVVVDTTALQKDWTMAGTRWGQVWALCRRRFLDVAVPHVVVLEAGRQMAEHVEAQQAKITSHSKDLDVHIDRLRSEGISRLSTSMWRDRPFALGRAEVSERISARVRSMSGEVLPLSTVSHQTLIDRDLDRRKPFHPTGKGYRDALAWLSTVDRMRHCPEGQSVIFVTANSDDYGKAGNLSLDLQSEVPAHVQEAGFEIVASIDNLLELEAVSQLVRALSDSTKEVTDPYDWSTAGPAGGEAVSAQDALSRAATSLTGRQIRASRGQTDGLDFDNVDFDDEFWAVEVGDVNPDRSTAAWRIYDAFAEDVLLVEAEISAAIVLRGEMDAEYFHLGSPSGFYFVQDQGTWDSPAVVECEKEVVLHFNATIKPREAVVTSLAFDHANRRN